MRVKCQEFWGLRERNRLGLRIKSNGSKGLGVKRMRVKGQESWSLREKIGWVKY